MKLPVAHYILLIPAVELAIDLQAAEQIVVLEQGQVREVGTHEELVKRNGVYADLVSSNSLSLSTSV